MVTASLLSPDEHARLEQEIFQAEANTSGEIYVVLAHSADDFRLVPVLWGAMFALLLPWILHVATNLSTTLILAAQVLGFIGVSALLSVHNLRYWVTPPSLAEEATRRAALAQFMAHGVHLTEARTGVLLYVSMLPRRIEVLADSGIHAKVSHDVWEKIVAQIASHGTAGRLEEGLVTAIRSIGALLAEDFPRNANDRDELPNRVIEIQERERLH